ncbi:MAG TPA: tetratricopeptide repeat protein [Steroidobacteraceae bacterium]|jgi:hypothetical protein
MNAFVLSGVFTVATFAGTSAVAQTLPARMVECESSGCGGDWKFDGKTGKAVWPQGVFADLTIESFNADHVVIRRKDTGRSTLGATAVYTGTIHGRRVEGEAVYNWPGHWGNKPMSVHWYADILEPGAKTAQSTTSAVPVSGGNGILEMDGIWRARLPPPAPEIFFAFVTQGADVTFVQISPGETKVTWRGRFASKTQLVGHSCGNSDHVENPNCLPETSTVAIVSATHVKDSFGAELDKVAGPDDIRYSVGLERAKLVSAGAYLAEKPVEIAGVWESPEPGGGKTARINIQQHDADVSINYVISSGIKVFSGRYEKNPMFSGTGKSRNSLTVEVPYSVFIDDPDHLRLDHEYQSHPYFRVTAPTLHDIPCDAKNRYHVTPVYASIRGQVALGAHDDHDAHCWLMISADAGIARSQSMLAAMYARGIAGAPPDYGQAFRFAALSAQQHDISGEILLAGLFREGKGTKVDPVKARFWEDQVEQSKQRALWQLLNTKGALGLSAVDIVGALMKAAVDDLNDPEAQADREHQQQQETMDHLGAVRAQYEN